MALTSRITIGVNQDNTGRNFGYDYQTPASLPVINLVTAQFVTIVSFAPLTGPLTINFGVGAAFVPPFVGDQMKIMFTSVAGATITFGTGCSVSSLTSIVTATKYNTVSFIFNGSLWVEMARSTGV